MTWVPLTESAIADLPGQLGVFEIAAPDGAVLEIGYAGGHELFGLRSALADVRAEAFGIADAGQLSFRVEFTHAYLTRWQELLMRHEARHGVLPVGNQGMEQSLGRLSVAGDSVVGGRA